MTDRVAVNASATAEHIKAAIRQMAEDGKAQLRQPWEHPGIMVLPTCFRIVDGERWPYRGTDSIL